MTATFWARRGSGLLAIVMLGLLLAACGGDDADPTPTLPPPPTSAAQPTVAAQVSTPRATPVIASGGTPVGSGETAQSLTRDQFRKQLLAAFPMTEPANKGGTVILGESGDISTVNPLLVFDTTTVNIVGTMFETLVGLSPVDGRPVPGLADSWEVAPDGITYTFHINQKATWHDGVDVTAEDVKFSFDAMLDPNTGSIYTTTVNQAIASYRVIDADTFEMVARDRFVSFLFNGPGSVFIVPQHIWGTVDPSAWSFDGGSTGQDPARVVGSGPFKFGEWVQGERVTVVRNDGYYDQVPNIDALTLVVQPDAEAAVIALQGGDTDVMEIIPPAQTQSVADTPGRKVEIYNIPQLTFYGMNLDAQRTPLFQSKEVRQALFYGLDRDSITQNIFFGFGEPAVGTQPKMSSAYAPDRMSPVYTFDIAKAKELLAQAGWTDTNGNGTVDKDGKEFEFEMTYSGGDGTVDQLAAYMQEAWKQIGVKMELKSLQGQALNEALLDHEFDMFLVGFSLGVDGDQGILFTCDAFSNGFNFGGFCNSRYDELDKQQKREFDEAKRSELLIEQSQIIWEEQPIGPIRFGIARTGYNDRLHNFYPTGYGFLWSLPYIWVDPA